MDIRKIKNWETFESELNKINAQLISYKKDNYGSVSLPLYRGQSDSTFALNTTLERYFDKPVSFDKYQHYLFAVKPAIEVFTEKKFEFDYRNDPETGWKFMGDVRFLKGQYEYMAYLRHHGFPSPLLDWSKSPYIALYFAYENANLNDDVAIFVYVEHLGSGKGVSIGSPEIATFGPYVTSHKRHFIQQSQYTSCVKKDGDDWYYCSHEEAFNTTDTGQDLLIKLTLPGSEKDRILLKLDTMNINAFSLYGSDEGLMRMLAFREKKALF